MWAWKTEKGHCPLAWSAGLASVLRAWETVTSFPALEPAACPRGHCYFCQRGEVIIAQPLPAGRALQPRKGAWGGDAGCPQIGPAGGGQSLQIRAQEAGQTQPRPPVRPRACLSRGRRALPAKICPGQCWTVPTGGRHRAWLSLSLTWTQEGAGEVPAQGNGWTLTFGNEAARVERFPAVMQPESLPQVDTVGQRGRGYSYRVTVRPWTMAGGHPSCSPGTWAELGTGLTPEAHVSLGMAGTLGNIPGLGALSPSPAVRPDPGALASPSSTLMPEAWPPAEERGTWPDPPWWLEHRSL